MKLFEICEVRNTQTEEVYCRMPRIAWVLTEPRRLLGFLSGAIVMSYMCDPDCERGVLFHFADAFIAWYKNLRHEKITPQSQNPVIK